MELLEIIIKILDPVVAIINGNKNNYRICDYVIFLILSFGLLIFAIGDYKLTTILICGLLAILIASILGTVTNALMKQKR